MRELQLKYGCNPNQTPASIAMEAGELPFQVLNGRPGYINFLDALNGWQLVRELREACGVPAAASFKHVSPAGAALGLPLGDTLRTVCGVALNARLSPLACAYARARGADRMSGYGDWAALSDVCDEDTARLLQREVSDGVIAPGYTGAALEILKGKRKGGYGIVQVNPDYTPPATETRQVFGVRFTQKRNDAKIDEKMLYNRVTNKKELTGDNIRDLLVALITLKYTQSNSVCYAADGMAVGVGAGQQSRIHCTRLAGDKADRWHLRAHPAVLELSFLEGIARPARDNAIDQYLGEEADVEALLADGAWQRLFSARPAPLAPEAKRAWLGEVRGVALGSDAFFPFSDNIERAARSGVCCVAQPGGSLRDDNVIDACNARGMVMAFTGLRLFHH